MDFASIISGLFKPAVDLVDELHTSEEERLTLKSALLTTQAGLLTQLIGYFKTLVEAQAKVIEAEAKGQSFLQRNWRPIIMLEFGFIIFWNYIVYPIFGTGKVDIPPDMWGLLKIGLGGYVVGRSVEKTVPGIISALKSREK